MNKPTYTSAATQDLTDILLYIGRDNPVAALDWVEKIEAKCLLIAAQPGVGELQPRFGEGVRASAIGRYVIYYRQKADCVEILRVISGDRNVTRL